MLRANTPAQAFYYYLARYRTEAKVWGYNGPLAVHLVQLRIGCTGTSSQLIQLCLKQVC